MISPEQLADAYACMERKNFRVAKIHMRGNLLEYFQQEYPGIVESGFTGTSIWGAWVTTTSAVADNELILETDPENGQPELHLLFEKSGWIRI